MDRRFGRLAKLVPWMVAIFLVIMGQAFDLPLISAQFAGGYFASGNLNAGERLAARDPIDWLDLQAHSLCYVGARYSKRLYSEQDAVP